MSGCSHRFLRSAAAVIAAALAVLLFAACQEAGEENGYSYEVDITVTGDAGAGGMTVDVIDETTGTTVASQSATTSMPVTISFAGAIDYENETAVSLTAQAASLGDGGSFSVEVVYTENAYAKPVSYTIEQGSAMNSSGGVADTTYRAVFGLPYRP